MIIDVHSHFFPRNWPDLCARYGACDWPSIRHDGDGRATIMLGTREFRRIGANCWDVDTRLADLDEHGIDLQIICATPVLFAYTRPAQHAADCARLFNDAALEMCSRSNGRLLPLAQVPLQDVDASCLEVSRAMRAGHLGIQIGNHVGDLDLDDAGLQTLLAHCAAEGAAVLVHPWDMMGGGRMKKYLLPWLVGMPAETHLSIAHLILSGAFERLPRSLRLCFVHGGGSFAFLIGRLDNAWNNYESIRERCPALPSKYVERFCVDSAVFREGALRLLLDVMGPQQVMLGTDYPFPLGEGRLGALVRSATRISEEERRLILTGNAQRFLNLGGTRLPAGAGGTHRSL